MTKSRHASNAKVKQQQKVARNIVKGNPEVLKTILAIKKLDEEIKTINAKKRDHRTAIKEMTNWPMRSISQYITEDKMDAQTYANYISALEDMRKVTGKQVEMELVTDIRISTTEGEGKRIDLVKKDARDTAADEVAA